MLTTISSFKNETFDKIRNEKDPVKKRIMYQNGNIQNAYYAYEFYEDDDKWAIVHAEYKLYIRGDVSYVKRRGIEGITFTRKTKKAKKWFGKSMNFLDPVILNFLKERNVVDLEWMNDLNTTLLVQLTKTDTVLGKIFSGKITNTRDLVKHHLKYSLKVSNLSPELFYQYFKVSGSRYEVIGNVMYYTKHIADPNEYLQKLIDNDGKLFFTNMDYDLLHQANILGRKLKVSWSERKKKEVHQQWTEEIMAYELDLVEDTYVDYKGILDVHPHGFKLINGQKELFGIGKREHHCVYTNYWNRVKEKEYFVLYGEISGETYTVGISRYGNNRPWEIDQIQKRYNSGCPAHVQDMFKDWINKENIQDFFSQECPIPVSLPIKVDILW